MKQITLRLKFIRPACRHHSPRITIYFHADDGEAFPDDDLPMLEWP